MNPSSKPRSDSTIDSRLDPLQAERFFDRLENGLSLREGVASLLSDHAITLSEMSLSRWAAKRRRAKTDAAFASALEILRADRAQAAEMLGAKTANPPDAAAEFAQASLLLANHALFAAHRDGNAERVAQTTRAVAVLQNSHTQRQRIELSRLHAERMHRHREFAALRSVIAFERQEFIVPPHEADEELREALEQLLDAEDGAAFATVGDGANDAASAAAPSPEEPVPTAASPAPEARKSDEPSSPSAAPGAREPKAAPTAPGGRPFAASKPNEPTPRNNLSPYFDKTRGPSAEPPSPASGSARKGGVFPEHLRPRALAGAASV